MTPFDAIDKAIGGCIMHQRYYDQRHYPEARQPGIVVARLMKHDPEFAEAVRNLRSEDIGPNVIRKDDLALGGFAYDQQYRDHAAKLIADFDRKLLRRGR